MAGRRPSPPEKITNMDDQEGNQQLYQQLYHRGTSFLTPVAAGRKFVPPLDLSGKIAEICQVYSGTSHDTEMIDEEEDADYEEEEEDDEDEEDEEVDEDFVDEEQGAELVDMGSFSEPGRKFMSKVWKEYEPIRVDGIVTAAECKHCARNICAERKHGPSSLRKHLKRCKERRKALRVADQLNASIMSPDGVALGPWTFNQAVSRKELMRMIVLHELPFSLMLQVYKIMKLIKTSTALVFMQLVLNGHWNQFMTSSCLWKMETRNLTKGRPCR